MVVREVVQTMSNQTQKRNSVISAKLFSYWDSKNLKVKNSMAEKCSNITSA